MVGAQEEARGTSYFFLIIQPFFMENLSEGAEVKSEPLSIKICRIYALSFSRCDPCGETEIFVEPLITGGAPAVTASQSKDKS